jgi:carbamoyl-phosphate synthase large subunit
MHQRQRRDHGRKSAGRRVELIRCFRKDAQALGIDLRIIAVDVRPELSAACREADACFEVPRSDSPEFKDALTRIAEAEAVQVIVPTNDLDLIPLSELAARLSASGVWALVGEPAAVRIARDKKATIDFLQKIGLPCPRTELATHADPDSIDYDVVAKPRHGSASVGVFYPESQHWLRESRFADYVVQKYIDGMEVTTSVYLSGFGQVHAVVSHSRLEVRSGEVSKAVTIDQPLLVEYARIFAKNLALIGPFCFQTIAPNHRRPQIIEINARFGGGYPIAHQAGAHFTRYIIEQALGREPTPCGSCTVGLVMLRYDAAVYVEP